MSNKENIQLRDVRDRLSELLGIGEPYPLRDLPVPAEGLTVPFKQAAKIPVELSQLGVLYQLHNPYEQLVTRPSGSGEVPVQAEGTGESLLLETPPIEDDITYTVLATKLTSKHHAYLHTPVIVKVGLDTSLDAVIRNHPPLDPTKDPLLSTDPRLCDYADTLEVEIPASQEGVDYKLLHYTGGGDEPVEVELSVADVRGTDGPIVLHSKPLMEDTTIWIRATKTFEPEEGRATQTQLLDISLPIKVKANRNLEPRVAAAIIDFGSQATIHIASTQSSAEYRIYAHRIRDPEYKHNPEPDSKVLRVLVQDEPDVQILRPDIPETWAELESYEPVSDFLQGNDGEISINIDNVEQDHVYLVEARKTHHITDTSSLTSSVWLPESLGILVRPDPNPDLTFSVVMQGAVTDGQLSVEAGQPGVFYFIRTQTSGGELPLPAYIHQRDYVDSRINWGLEQLEVGIDFVIAPDHPPEAITPDLERARLAPQPPLLESGPLAIDTNLYVRAMKGQTNVKAKLVNSAKIIALPEIRLAQNAVNRGEVATIQVIASKAGDMYELTLNGVTVQPVLPGDGTDLEFTTDVITQDSQFEVRVTRPGDAGIPLQRVQRLNVLLNPDAELAVSAIVTDVDYNGATEILIASSQVGVSYQLLVGESVLGEAKQGNGAQLGLSTGPLITNTTFAVRATRLDDTAVSVVLTQQVAVTVKPQAI